jgi:DNA gyrase inhibitor GyrI
MQKFQSLIKLFLLFCIVLIACREVKTREDKEIKTTLTLETQTNFSYIAYEHVGSYDAYSEILDDFLREIKTQQIIPTGPVFVIYHNNPGETKQEDLIWELGLPTAEGTMVKKPLILKNWHYEKIAKVHYYTNLPLTENIYPIIFDQISEKNLTYHGPLALRVLNRVENVGVVDDSITEIWIPIANPNRLSE